jgi:hypothetical protein
MTATAAVQAAPEGLSANIREANGPGVQGLAPTVGPKLTSSNLGHSIHDLPAMR